MPTMQQAKPKAATGSLSRVRLPDGSKSVQSRWVWRGFAFMAIIAMGMCITFAVGRQFYFAIAWGTISLGWFGFAGWLWRKHVVDDNLAWEASRGRR
jgi:hypothetical protein